MVLPYVCSNRAITCGLFKSPSRAYRRLDGLRNEADLSEEAVERIMVAFAADSSRIFTAALKKLRDGKGSKSAYEANSKFNGFEGSFASIEDFHRGAEETLQLGYPNPETEKGILLEHTDKSSMKSLFVTPNYRIATCLLVEYWWAVDPSAPSKEALDMLAKLVKDRGAYAGSVKPTPLYPGEVGDGFFETIVVLRLRSGSGTPDAAMKLAEQLTDQGLTERLSAEKDSNGGRCVVLSTEEERARGAQVLPQSACVEWLVRSSMLLAAPSSSTPSAEVAAVEQRLNGQGSAVVGVVLPIALARAHERLAAARVLETVSEILSRPAGPGTDVGVEELWVSERSTRYCGVPSVADLRKRLGELSTEDLRREAEVQWGVSAAPEAPRADVMWAAVDAFVQKELKADLDKALRAGFATLDAVLADFGVASAAGLDVSLRKLLEHWGRPGADAAQREELILAAVDALDSAERWEEVSVWVGLFTVRLQGRTRVGIEVLMKRERMLIAYYQLTKSEVLSINIYTGPEFVLLNGILRNFPSKIVDLLQGNTLCTTIFCISSGLKKIGLRTELPRDGFVYRGLGKMLLPQQFWTAQGTPAWKGGVERALMSTTSDKAVAMFYANGRGTVVEISVGRAHMGGDVSFISMVTPPTPPPLQHWASADSEICVTVGRRAVCAVLLREGEHPTAFHLP